MIPNIDIDINEFYKHIKLSAHAKGYKMNAKYKNLRIKSFFQENCIANIIKYLDLKVKIQQTVLKDSMQK